jgi:hydroxyethylthiazole kinase
MDTEQIASQMGTALNRIRETRPLIHQITNPVVMRDAANVTLHLGGLPVMAHAREEVAEMASQAAALVLNMGTPDPSRVEAMLIAGHSANEKGIPIVLDPVGAGATAFRTQSTLRLLEELRVTILRGNSGEVATLAGERAVVRGVETVQGTRDAASLVAALSGRWGTVVAITGERDYMSDGQRLWAVDNGHRWLTTITGTGCMATTAIATFSAVEPDALLATAAGLACLGLAAEQAAAEAHGPASFRVALLDRLYHLTPEQLAAGARIVALQPAT